MVYMLILGLPHPVAFWGVVRGRRKQMQIGVAEDLRKERRKVRSLQEYTP